MTELSAGDLLPDITTPPPGPRSLTLAADLREYESPNVTFVSQDLPIFWREALGANVLDVDDNLYIDLCAGFATAGTGHRNPRVIEAIRQQLDRVAHGMGDVHPPAVKVELLTSLADVAPGNLTQTILASSGSEAVESALKTARLASGRPGVLYFSGAYHGLGYGALSVTDGEQFREPFQDQLGIPTIKVPFPDPFRPPAELQGQKDLVSATLELIAARLDTSGAVGAVIVEPIQGRGGVVIPPDGFLLALREECDRRGLILIFDEILTGLGRTGRWFACDHEGVTPDLLCLGKSLTGALSFSACIGRPDVMAAWPISTGEAIHTSTFLGHPPGCAAALAQIAEIGERDLIAQGAKLGEHTLRRLGKMKDRFPVIGDIRGRGLLLGVELVRPDHPMEPDADSARQIAVAALKQGVILLASGRAGNVISLTPPLTITKEQLDFALGVLEDCLARL